VHKTFEQLDRSSLQTDAQTRSRLIPLQWVYKTKRDGSKKARLVVVGSGCAQRAGLDYYQTHCSTLKATSLRFLAATAAIQGLHMRRFEFVSAFLQGDLEPGEQIACRPPPGYETLGDDGNHKIWRVLKPIYGMQQGGRRWQRSLFPWFKALGFRQCEADNCVFSMTAAGDALYVGCYVDDLFILYLKDGADSLYASFTHKLTQRWEVEDEGEVTDLLNIEISRQGASITLRQTAYIDKLTKEWFPHGPPAHVQLNTVCRILRTSGSSSSTQRAKAPHRQILRSLTSTASSWALCSTRPPQVDRTLRTRPPCYAGRCSNQLTTSWRLP